MARKQILSNETPNDQGFVVTNESIDWSRYVKNPLFLRNPETGKHKGIPIGRIDNITFENGAWVGELSFGTSELAQQSQKDYDDGILNGVSISGLVRMAERNGRRYTTNFLVYEISLVNIPSNPDCVAIREDKTSLSSVVFNAEEIEEVVSLSARDIEIINQIENNMHEEETTRLDPAEEKISLSALERIGGVFRDLFGFNRPETTDAETIGELAAESTESAAEPLADVDENMELAAEPEKGDESEESLSAGDMAEQSAAEEEAELAEANQSLASGQDEEIQPENASTESDPGNPPTSLSTGSDARVYEISQTQKIKNMKVKPFFKYVTDKENESKLARIVALSAHSGSDSGVSEVNLSSEEGADEARTAIQELASSMVADARFMAVVKNITFQVNGGRQVYATETIKSLASGDKSGAFVNNADLAKVVWLSLFVRQLFPDDSWASRVRRLSVADREGVIWVESAINPEIYFGDRAPLDAKTYLYDDMPRGLERKVFSLQPILWQTANTDILNYNDVATGTSEGMAKLASAVHSYWLQVIAEAVPATNHIPMSGDVFDSANRFPINPAATGNLHGMTTNDLLAAQGKFIARNLPYSFGSGVAVFSEPYFTSLQQNPEVKSSLTLQLNNVRPDRFVYSGFEVLARSFVAAFNTAISSVVDAEKYFDKPVDFSTGAIDDSHVKPVLTATTYDIGLGFIPEEVIVGVGKTNIHMVSDPNNYGWKMSADMSTGAGTLRSSADGICLFVPTVE